jgi:5,10-methenyltetrahydrofolate synthetase
LKKTSSPTIACDPIEAADRAAARRELRARRAAMGGEGRLEAAAALGARLQELVEDTGRKVVAGYWAMKEEPDLEEVMARWHADGLQVVLPRVVASEAPLAFARWRPGVQLVPGPFGTLHPDDPEPMAPQLLVIPCLGFDGRCFRLGYGGGYYDRTLERLPGALTVGVAYDCCEVRGFVPHEHDLPMDWVVTERRVLRRSAPSG